MKFSHFIVSIFLLLTTFLFMSCGTSETASEMNTNTSSSSSSPARPKPLPTPITDNAVLGKLMKSVDPAITYAHLTKNSSRYEGQTWAFTGKILQIQEEDGKSAALVSSHLYGSDNVHVLAGFTTDFVDGDEVYIIGVLNGDFSYTSRGNYQLSVPEIIAQAIVKSTDVAKIKASAK